MTLEGGPLCKRPYLCVAVSGKGQRNAKQAFGNLDEPQSVADKPEVEAKPTCLVQKKHHGGGCFLDLAYSAVCVSKWHAVDEGSDDAVIKEWSPRRGLWFRPGKLTAWVGCVHIRPEKGSYL